MNNRAMGLLALAAVITVSIVFGMVAGARFGAPEVAFAAERSDSAMRLVPASTRAAGMVDLADIVEQSLPAVVSVTSTASARKEGDADSPHPFMDDPFFRRFFGEPEGEGEPRRSPIPRMGAGSGFLISPDGYVLTNNHVVEDFERVDVTLQDGKSYPADVVGTDPSIDLALLKIDPQGNAMPALPFGDSDRVRVGEWVIAIGNPLEFQQTVTVGVVSGKERRVPLPSTDIGVVSFIQTDAAINLGNSGGPLLDSNGNVIGINTAIRRQNLAEGIGFALPINLARSVIEQLRETGRVKRGFIGITMHDGGIDEATREYFDLPSNQGVLVGGVARGGPADEAGIERGDVITEVEGARVVDNNDLISKISSRQPGDQVRLVLLREGRELERAVTLGDRDEGMRQAASRPSAERQPEVSEEARGLGITVESLDDEASERLGFDPGARGVLVVDVEFDSEASRKGMLPDMLVVALNDRTVRGIADWDKLVRDLAPGSAVKLDVLAPAPGEDRTMYFFLRVPDRED